MNTKGNGTPRQYSCLENPMDGGGAWQAAVLWGLEESDTTENFTLTFHFHALEKEMATHSSILAWRIPGTGSLVGCHLWGCTESDTTEETAAGFLLRAGQGWEDIDRRQWRMRNFIKYNRECSDTKGEIFTN